MTFFVGIAKLLNIILDNYTLFLSHVKFFNDDNRKENTNLALLRRIINELFRAMTNIQQRKFRLKEGLRLV